MVPHTIGIPFSRTVRVVVSLNATPLTATVVLLEPTQTAGVDKLRDRRAPSARGPISVFLRRKFCCAGGARLRRPVCPNRVQRCETLRNESPTPHLVLVPRRDTDLVEARFEPRLHKLLDLSQRPFRINLRKPELLVRSLRPKEGPQIPHNFERILLV